MGHFKNIVVPVDLSEHSSAAIEMAVDIARDDHAKIWLLHCYPIAPDGVSPYGITAPVAYYDAIRNAAAKQLAELAEKLIPNDIEAVQRVSGSPPPEAIAVLVGEVEADLIVMGTRGLTGFKHVMLGSVTERTIRSAECPVLTVKAKDRPRNEP